VGEASIFQDGISIFELFFRYSARKDFCMHSDWVMGYILKFYISSSQASGKDDQTLVGMKTYPSCGNITVAGGPRPCTPFSPICHNQNPMDMEFLAISSYAHSPQSFKSMPKMEMTELETAMCIVKDAQEDRPKKFAYACVLGWNPDEKQNKLHLDAIRVMIQSLKNTAADFIVLMMYENSDAEALLLSEGAIVFHIVPIVHTLKISHFKPWFVDIAFAKLRAFELTQYKRVQLLDIDVSIENVKKMDELFDYFPDVKLVAEGLGSDSPLRAGWLMIRPSLDDFNKMQQLLEQGVFTSEHGWDNLDLPVQYPGWAPVNPFYHWNFYGSELEQGQSLVSIHSCYVVLSENLR